MDAVAEWVRPTTVYPAVPVEATEFTCQPSSSDSQPFLTKGDFMPAVMPQFWSSSTLDMSSRAYARMDSGIMVLGQKMWSASAT